MYKLILNLFILTAFVFQSTAFADFSPCQSGTTIEQCMNQLNLRQGTLPSSSVIFNVQSYGAKGDGVADDTVAIQNAINAAHAVSGSEVYFPGGKTYLISNQSLNSLFSDLVVYSNTKLYLETGAVLKRKANDPAYMIRNASGTAGDSNINISGGGTIDANAAWVAFGCSYVNSTKTFTCTNIAGTPMATYSLASGDDFQFILTDSITGGVVGGAFSISGITNNGSTLTVTIVDGGGTLSSNSAGSAVEFRLRRTRPVTSTATAGWLGQSVLLTNCTNVTMDNLSFLNEAKFSIWLSGIQGAFIRNIIFGTGSDGLHIEGTSNLTGGSKNIFINNIGGFVADNMLAIGSDEGTYYTPNTGPFTTGTVSQLTADGIYSNNSFEPVRFFGTAGTLQNDITIRNVYGTIYSGAAVDFISDSGGSLAGSTMRRIILENIYAQPTGGVVVSVTSANMKELTINNMAVQGTGIGVYFQSTGTGMESLIINNALLGTSTTGATGALVREDSTPTLFPNIQIKNVNGTMGAGGRVFLANFNGTGKQNVEISGYMNYQGGTGGAFRIVDLSSTVGGVINANLTGFSLIGTAGSNTGVVARNASTTSGNRLNLNLTGCTFQDIDTLAEVANSANMVTNITGVQGSNTYSNVSGMVSGPLDGSGNVTAVGGAVTDLTLFGETYVPKTTTYTAREGETVLADPSGGGFTITLPAALSSVGPITIKNVTTSTNTITIGRSGSDTINATAANQTITTANGFMTLLPRPGRTDWSVVNN